MKLERPLRDEPASNKVTHSILIKIRELLIDDRSLLFPNHQLAAPLCDFKPMIRIGNEPFHQGIRYFDIPRPSHALQLPQESGRISRMLEYVGGNDKIERFVLERQVLDKSNDGRTVGLEWNPMSLARDFVGIKQDIRPRVRVAARSNF
jgi:hypothetical protein